MENGIVKRTNRLLSIAGLTTLGGTLLLDRAVATARADTATEWPNTGNDPGGSYFSPLKTINDKNVGIN
jgi:glucose dehydrogenase